MSVVLFLFVTELLTFWILSLYIKKRGVINRDFDCDSSNGN